MTPPVPTDHMLGKVTGQRATLWLSDIWPIRVASHLACRAPDLTVFNLAVDAMLRRCDPISLRLGDAHHGSTTVGGEGSAS